MKTINYKICFYSFIKNVFCFLFSNIFFQNIFICNRFYIYKIILIFYIVFLQIRLFHNFKKLNFDNLYIYRKISIDIYPTILYYFQKKGLKKYIYNINKIKNIINISINSNKYK